MAKVEGGFQVGLSWVPLNHGKVPRGAISVQDGIYVARCEHSGEKIPGKYVVKYETCYVSFAGEEKEYRDCEILCDTSFDCDGSCYKWVSDSGGDVPKNAIVAGKASDGSPLFICKAMVGDEMCVGKVHKGHSCCYIPYAGEEHSVDNYEVLVLKK